ncbi:LLM class flavin-dependent oxidoreductase [Meiothermus hypogaeus]|uniref:Luciferase n=2 Tax=Meiothermus hypogaeus TaxID=884155 RepID=A0A511R3M5_9DEIN|nr:LLM class flavin-dependent oxidoreductase [Meiothermus hypogaeus]RIH80623.1 Alkanal monooxygenase alpha chain [Meiothermus hypogaeus]GEM83606.1 luciferase [Meiothermus hypogaeus NBRC 106114]
MEPSPFELGLYTFVENTPDPYTGLLQDPAQRMKDLLETAELADQVGLDVFAVGEHHREEYLASAPTVILAAIATRTRRIRLSSAVTVLSSDDPVRVFQQFATLDLLSGGRAEIMAGRGSFIESFPLFGYDLDDYNELFEEKLGLLLQIRAQERVTWSGKHRPAIQGQPIYPRPVQNPLPVWVAVGGTPTSVVRAARLGLPMALAIIGGLPERFAPLLELYRQTARQLDLPPQPLSINAHGFIADDPKEALELSYATSSPVMNRIGRERGWPPQSRAQYEAGTNLRGALFVGHPEQIIEKILYQHQIFGHQRFLLQLSVGTVPHAKMMRAIELFGTEVAPVVRREIAKRAAPSLTAS